ncbi:hypothetical protein LQ368_16065 [Halobacterium noricense]|uniref:TrkA C-terminal domain-containing protein n=1 Tax=Halobacterium noricense TaxID=223182 RepID=UPI001F3D6E60|nr:TrkA C-terminal domain-containing protein [Halobacterium noricense]MCG1004934.1 hypothetical protein [Halobacterium noricense]
MEHDVHQHINASHGMFVPGQFGTFPEEHSQSGIRPYLRSGLPDVESYDDLFLMRNPAVTDTEKATAAFRAGADYVLSVQRVSARLVAAEVHGERVMDPVSQIRLVRADASPFAGQTVATASDPQKGWTVVGVVHDGAVSTNQAAAIEAGDEVFVAGSDSAIRGFEQSVD